MHDAPDNTRRRLGITLAVALLATGCAAAEQSATAELATRIDPIVEAAMAADSIPAVSVGVLQDGEVAFAKGYGFADVENQVPATENTVYRIGSITKQFTAAAVMLLVEEGKLRLDAGLTEFYPDYPVGGYTVTVEHLLNHTSGIRTFTGMPWYRANMRDDATTDQVIGVFSAAPFDFAPGSRYRYNNSAYYLLGAVIEKAAGMRYDEFIREQFFEPLGMDDSHYLRVAPIIPRRASGYEVRDGELVNSAFLSMTLPYAAGALGSSVLDLLAWDRALFDHEVVGAASLEAMTTPTRLSDGSEQGYGYGLGLGELEGHRTIGHGGGIDGFRSQMTRYPDDGLTIVVLANSGSANPGRIQQDIARELLGLGPAER